MQKMQVEEVKRWLNEEQYKLLTEALARCREMLCLELVELMLSEADDKIINDSRKYMQGQLAVIETLSNKELLIDTIERADLIEESEDDYIASSV